MPPLMQKKLYIIMLLISIFNIIDAALFFTRQKESHTAGTSARYVLQRRQ